MKRYIIIFGAVAGGVILLYSLALFAIMGDFSKLTVKDLQLAETLGYLRYLILLLGVVMGMVAYRRQTHAPISYKRMLGIGVGVAAVTAVIVGILEGVYGATNPEFFDHYGRLAEEALRADGATHEKLKAFHEQQQSFAWMRNPWALGAFYFVETALIGTAFALVAALFTRRKEGEVDAGSHTLVNQTT